MRKYTLSFLFLATGLIFLLLGLTKRSSKGIYSENVFAEKASKLKNDFINFSDQIQTDFREMEAVYTDTLKVRDTLQTRDYFLNKLRSRKEMSTLGFFQEKYRVVAKRDGTSIVYALDSTENLDVVRWRRFEHLKQISSWNESFEDEIEGREWYEKLKRAEGEITWFQNDTVTTASEGRENAFLYCGYSYSTDQTKTILIFEFSKEQLLQRFGLKSRNLSPLLRVKTTDGRIIEFGGNLLNGLQKDALISASNQHFKRFEKDDQGTFNFSHMDKIYWNSFVRFPPESGLDNYLYIVNNQELSSYTAASDSRLGIWGGSALILLGIFLLVLRKRFFYKPNRMQIPDLVDLLKDDENRFLEFKSSLRWDLRQQKVNPDLEKIILKTLAAFGNSDGGILLIGIDDDKNVVGLEKDFHSLKKQDADYFEIHLRNILHKSMGVKYVSKHIRTQFETVAEGKVVCKVKVIPGDEPLFLKFKNKNGNLDEKFFVRSGNSSHEIESIPEINDYINKKYKK